MQNSLGSRQKDYEKAYDYQLIKRLPIVIRIDGRSFSRVCRKVKKPYEPFLLEVMADTMFYVATEIDGAVFAYQQSDEITIVVKNDQSSNSEPWYANRIQKIASVSASLATLEFNRAINKFKDKLDLTGDAMFDARVFAVPTVNEAVNNLIWRQQDCIRNAVSGAAQELLGRKIGKRTALKMLHGQSTLNKVNIMRSECGVDFEEEYPASFRMGVAAYKIPFLYTSKDGDISTRKKWTLDWDIPNFVADKDFVFNVIFSGHDVFRQNSVVDL